MQNKTQLKVEKYRQKALKQIQHQEQCILDMFPQLEIPSDLESQEIQYVDVFDEMKLLEPNEEGTGRITLQPNLDTIGILNLSLNDEVNSKSIGEWINAYLGINVKILNQKMALYYEKGNFHIQDLQTKKIFKLKKNREDIINVFSIFDVLIEIRPKTICSLIAIIDQDIFDPCNPESNIVGRACGDRVCVVQYQENSQEFYSTIVHELLHTFGFDHCYLWDCLMNENISNSMQLCMCDLEKLLLVKQQDIKKRYENILKVSKKLGFTKECEWLQKMIKQITK